MDDIVSTLLGLCFIREEDAPTIIAALKVEFLTGFDLVIYNSIKSIIHDDLPITFNEVMARINVVNTSEIIMYINDIIDVSPATHLPTLLRLYGEECHAAALDQRLSDCRNLLLDKSLSYTERVRKIEHQLLNTLSSYQPVQRVDAFEEYRKGLDSTLVNALRVPFGLKCLEPFFRGIMPEELCVIGARPSLGKTTLALNIAYKYAKSQHDRAVVFFSLEMSTMQLINKLVSLSNTVDSNKYHEGVLLPEEVASCISAADELEALVGSSLYISDEAVTSMSQMKTFVAKVAKEKPIGLIVIDYIQLIDGLASKNNVERVSMISREIKLMSMKYKCPIIALSQLNRQSENRSDKRPGLADLRESGSIEQDADMVILLHNSTTLSADVADDPNSIVELIVAKNRHGSRGTAYARFEKKCGRFHSINEVAPQGETKNED